MATMNYRLTDGQYGRLSGRAGRQHNSPTTQAKQDMFTLWQVLSAEAERLPLSVAEASALAQVMGGPDTEEIVGQRLFAETSDAFRLARQFAEESSYGAQHGIHEEHLLDRLQMLGPAGDMAIRDALSRWWDADLDPTADGFRAVGLSIQEQ